MDDNHKTSSIKSRPLDPTKNAEDLIGDATGMTGITTGNSKTTSSSPSDHQKDEARTGSINPTLGNSPDDEQAMVEGTSDTAYNESIHQTMSSTYANIAKERASETDESSGKDDVKSADAFSTINEDENTLSDPQLISPASRGEQSVSGTTSNPQSDDDTLENAQNMGQQLGETTEEPLELDIARDIDNAEEYTRTH